MPRFLDKAGNELPIDARGQDIAEAVYEIKIKRGVRYAPHPAFTRDATESIDITRCQRPKPPDKRTPFDFADLGTRELTAHDYFTRSNGCDDAPSSRRLFH